jgi:hypothetical protein
MLKKPQAFSFPKERSVTEAQAIVVAAIITAIGGGIFLVIAAWITRPKKKD